VISTCHVYGNIPVRVDLQKFKGAALQPGPAGDDGGAFLAGARQADDVDDDAGEIVDEGAEAVHWQTVGGFLDLRLAPGRRRRSSLLHRRGALAPRRLTVIVLEEQRREALSHVPFHVVGQHAQEHMSADMILGVDPDRPDLEVGLGDAEGALHGGKACRPRQRRRARCC